MSHSPLAAVRLDDPLPVYIVEASKAIRERLEEMLACIEGTCCVGWADGVETALSDIIDKHPDIVILDVHLDQGNGFDVLRAIHHRAPDIQVYVFSNHSTEPYRRLAHQLGAVAFFDKTIEVEAMRNLLSSRAAQRRAFPNSSIPKALNNSRTQ
jgi:DNA-binding NarL/FixJ family response regulator